MKVELHLHTSRYSGCAVNTPEEMMAGLIAAGYEAVFITEHAAVWPVEELDELRGKFPQLKIFGGVELYVGPHHLLVLGTSDASYLDICDDAPAVLDKARQAGHLTVLAHPFRWEEGFEMLFEGLRPDAIECRTCNQERPAADRAAAVAAEMGLAGVNSGDSHGLDFLDRFWIETPQPLVEPTDIRRIILAGAYKNCVREQ